MPKYLDEIGVQYLWNKISMEDYPNNETLIAVLNAIDATKVDKVDGKELSTNDFTNEYKEKLTNIEAGAQVNVQPDWLQTDETAMDFIKNKPDEEDALAILSEINFVNPVMASDGSVFTDNNGALYTI